MSPCEYLDQCPIFGRFKTEGMKNFWINTYCKGRKQDSCARKVRKARGELVPITMLPNGDVLESLAEE